MTLTLILKKRLEQDCERLQGELRKLSHKIFVTNDGDKLIDVHGDIAFKAYVPKNYYGWQVVFHEFKGGEVHIDLDKDLSGL